MRITLKQHALFIFVLVLFVVGPPQVEAQDRTKTGQPDKLAKTETEQGAAAGRSQDEYFELMQLFVDALDQVDRNYVKKVERRKLIDAAIRGMLEELDEHSNYIPPRALDRFRSGVESEFGGIGIQVSVRSGVLEVISPIYGSPAFRAGISAGDRITEIEGTSTKGITIDEAVKLLKGKVNTKVNVTVFHPHTKKSEKVTLNRELVRVETVMGDRRKSDGTWEYDVKDGIAYVRITSFGRRTANELQKTLRQLEKNDEMQALVLDLRFNPGGLLATAIQVCDLFIEEGRIVSTEGRATPKRAWDAHEKGTFGGFPMVVLINSSSASASEIVSACLQDHQRAIVMGERSFGKGSVQNIVELEGGKSAMKLTTAAYLRPSGKNIHRHKGAAASDVWGVTPNDGFTIRTTVNERLAIMRNRQQRDIIRRADDDRPAVPRGPDAQLEKALEHLLAQIAPSTKEDDATQDAEDSDVTAETKASTKGEVDRGDDKGSNDKENNSPQNATDDADSDN